MEEKSELLQFAALLLDLRDWTTPHEAAMLVSEGYAVQRDLKVHSPIGRSVNIKIIELTTYTRASLEPIRKEFLAAMQSEELKQLQTFNPRSLKKCVVNEDFVRRYTEKEFARLLRRVKTDWKPRRPVY